MTVEETIKILHSIEDRSNNFPNMTDCDWIAIAAAKRHLFKLKPNYENLVYTKQELRDMGFAFDLNGNIVDPKEVSDMTVNYVFNRVINYLENVDTDDYMVSGIFQMSDLIMDFKKAMEL